MVFLDLSHELFRPIDREVAHTSEEPWELPEGILFTSSCCGMTEMA